MPEPTTLENNLLEPTTCTCDTQEHDDQECPYAAEINDETNLCNCCPKCRQECLESI